MIHRIITMKNRRIRYAKSSRSKSARLRISRNLSTSFTESCLSLNSSVMVESLLLIFFFWFSFKSATWSGERSLSVGP
eukprot:34046_5